MKKICALVLTTAMLLSFAACGKKDQSNVSSQDTTATQQADDNGGETTKAPSADALVLLPGKLVIVNEGDNVPVIKGINVSGNRAGTAEFNSKFPSTDGVRCIFELNEYLEFYLDANETSEIKVFAFKHVEDANEYIENNRFNGAFAHCDLEKPENAADCWGSMYFHPEECEPGYYDLVFVSESNIVAMMQIKIFSEGELSDKSDDELNALMKSF